MIEEIIDPDTPIVDPHHHLWSRPEQRYLQSEVLADLNSGHNVVSTVFVQCGAMYREGGAPELRVLGETESVLAIAEQASNDGSPIRLCEGIVGHVDLTLGGAVAAILDGHRQIAGDRLKGIRHITAWHPTKSLLNPMNIVQDGMMEDEKFRSGFACLAPRGLSFDAWILHTQLEEFRRLANAFPETCMVLNHLGGPIGIGPYTGRQNQTFAEWRHGMRALADLPNVYVKLGGLGMPLMGLRPAESDGPATSSDLAVLWRPYILECIELFSAERCMFESNFPVDAVTCSYPVVWNTFKRVVAMASASEKSSLYHDTAAKVYRIHSVKEVMA